MYTGIVIHFRHIVLTIISIYTQFHMIIIPSLVYNAQFRNITLQVSSVKERCFHLFQNRIHYTE